VIVEEAIPGYRLLSREVVVDGKLIAQLACVAQNDANQIYDSYAWPPRPPLSDEERLEARRLEMVARRLWYRAAAKGWGSVGTDEIFGE
jgi:hypothetical protein